MRTLEESRLNSHLKDLRVETLEKGFPFMLRDPEIAAEGFIYEFPDGSMKLMNLEDNLQTIVEVRALTTAEITVIRKKLNLPVFQYA
ncbi:hypothetical protein MUK70_13855 [Dyadobacter chenwenxiniae]|uniref:Uncharacterized protein n=1 Tax=Dyadobacter chenwenxiniae TaxID=2906456 RepID=A0A9X1TJN9_9BACT|nr:hypothetical protein [Dyadobacter chenwenxiniae]MCF0060328.1 hypothetical protein [Dyadobacter chenwenxiniae]UON86061.1 hypothetical protein MUK70_13855 [Dyadobacter chenwenxiniae]